MARQRSTAPESAGCTGAAPAANDEAANTWLAVDSRAAGISGIGHGTWAVDHSVLPTADTAPSNQKLRLIGL